MKKYLIFLVTLFFVFMFLKNACAQYNLDRGVVNNGGEIVLNSLFRLNGAIAQPIIGTETNSLFKNNLGFWYQTDVLVTSINDIQNNYREELMLQNYPNPFSAITTISYFIRTPFLQGTEGKNLQNKVVLSVYDILGKEIKILVNEIQPAGKYHVEWNASEFPRGVYFYKLTTSDYIQTKKMLLFK